MKMNRRLLSGILLSLFLPRVEAESETKPPTEVAKATVFGQRNGGEYTYACFPQGASAGQLMQWETPGVAVPARSISQAVGASLANIKPYHYALLLTKGMKVRIPYGGR